MDIVNQIYNLHPMQYVNQIYNLHPMQYLQGYDLLKKINDPQTKADMKIYVDHMKLLAHSTYG